MATFSFFEETFNGEAIGPEGPYWLGITFESSEVGKITAVLFRKIEANHSTETPFRIWKVSGASVKLETTITHGELDQGWIKKTLSSPLEIEAGVKYIAAYHIPASSFYAAKPGVFSSALTKGPLTAPKNEGAVKNGAFSEGTVEGAPMPNQGGGANYFADFIFDNTAAGESKGSVTLAGTGTIAPTGLLVALGSVTISGTGTLSASASQLGSAELTGTGSITSAGSVTPGNAEYLDRFNRANEARLGNGWENAVVGCQKPPLESERVQGAVTETCFAVWPTVFEANQEAYDIIKSQTTSRSFMLLGRVTKENTSSLTCYDLEINTTTGAWELYAFVNGTSTLLATATKVVGSGDKFWLRMSGTTIKGIHINSEAVETVVIEKTDSSVSGKGKVGLGITTAGIDMSVDDFGGGNIAGTSATLSGQGSISSSGTRTTSSVATISGLGTITPSGIKKSLLVRQGFPFPFSATIINHVSGVLALSGTGSISGTSSLTKNGTCAINGAGSIAGTGERTRLGTDVIAGNGSLTSSGVRSTETSILVLGLGSVQANGGQIVSAQASISGSSSLEFIGTNNSSEFGGASTINGQASIVGSSLRTTFGTCPIVGNGTLEVSGTRVIASTVSTSGIGQLNVEGQRFTIESITVNGQAEIVADSIKETFGIGVITGQGLITSTISREVIGFAEIEGKGKVIGRIPPPVTSTVNLGEISLTFSDHPEVKKAKWNDYITLNLDKA